jgi:hypothetical protein
VTDEVPTPRMVEAEPRPDAPPAEPAAPVVHERVVVIPTRTYWVVLGLSLLFLFLAAGLYRDYLPFFSIAFYYATVVIALVVILWCVIGLARRYRIVHRTVRGVRETTVGVVEGIRNTSEAHEGAVGRFVQRWAKRLEKVIRLVVWIVRLPIRILVWAWYTAEKLVWRMVLIAYDLLYYPAYAAWLLAHWAVRTSLRVTAFALRVAWKVLRLPLYLPLIKTWWRRSQRPKILARWRAFRAHRDHLAAQRVDRGRRLAQLRGENPDRWQADYRRRRGFPLPHPEKGRIYIRKRIAHIVAVQQARRAGKPAPKWESSRRKLREERRAQEQAETPSEPEATPAEKPKRLRGLLRGRRSEGADDLEFLPEPLAERFKRALEDAQVDAAERRNLLEAAEASPDLTDEQKQTIRRVVASWADRDAGASA